MVQSDSFLRSLNDQLSRFLSSSEAREDLRRSLNIAVQRAFDSLDLVSRDQFDEQVERLRSAEELLARMEEELAALRARIDTIADDKGD